MRHASLARHYANIWSRPCRSVTRRSLFNFPGFPGTTPEIQRFREVKQLPYTQEQMYRVVADAHSYPSFLPFCTGCRVLEESVKRDAKTGVQQMAVEMSVGYGPFEESYVSQVTCVPYDSVKAVAADSTPLFHSLESIWRFRPLSTDLTHVTLDLEYAFTNPVYASVASGVLGQMSERMVKAFEERCRTLYGS